MRKKYFDTRSSVTKRTYLWTCGFSYHRVINSEIFIFLVSRFLICESNDAENHDTSILETQPCVQASVCCPLNCQLRIRRRKKNGDRSEVGVLRPIQEEKHRLNTRKWRLKWGRGGIRCFKAYSDAIISFHQIPKPQKNWTLPQN